MKVLSIFSILIKSWESNIHSIFLKIAHIDKDVITHIITCVYIKPSGNWNFHLLGNTCISAKKEIYIFHS